MREVAAGQHQQRDLLQLRNRLVHHLSAAPAPAPAAAATATATAPAAAAALRSSSCRRCRRSLAMRGPARSVHTWSPVQPTSGEYAVSRCGEIWKEFMRGGWRIVDNDAADFMGVVRWL